MPWGWTGRNSLPSKASLLNAPTTATTKMEREFLRRAADTLPDGLAAAARQYVASEHLAHYKADADAELHEEFTRFLAGDNNRFLYTPDGGDLRYTDVPFVTPWDRSLLDPNVLANPNTELRVLDRYKQKRIPWGNRNLLHIPGAHAFLAKDIIKRREFDAYIGALHYNGPQTMEQAWHYFKYIVKGAQPDAKDLRYFDGWDTDPHNGVPDDTYADNNRMEQRFQRELDEQLLRVEPPAPPDDDVDAQLRARLDALRRDDAPDAANAPNAAAAAAEARAGRAAARGAPRRRPAQPPPPPPPPAPPPPPPQGDTSDDDSDDDSDGAAGAQAIAPGPPVAPPSVASSPPATPAPFALGSAPPPTPASDQPSLSTASQPSPPVVEPSPPVVQPSPPVVERPSGSAQPALTPSPTSQAGSQQTRSAPATLQSPDSSTMTPVPVAASQPVAASPGRALAGFLLPSRYENDGTPVGRVLRFSPGGDEPDDDAVGDFAAMLTPRALIRAALEHMPRARDLSPADFEREIDRFSPRAALRGLAAADDVQDDVDFLEHVRDGQADLDNASPRQQGLLLAAVAVRDNGVVNERLETIAEELEDDALDEAREALRTIAQRAEWDAAYHELQAESMLQLLARANATATANNPRALAALTADAAVQARVAEMLYQQQEVVAHAAGSVDALRIRRSQRERKRPNRYSPS